MSTNKSLLRKQCSKYVRRYPRISKSEGDTCETSGTYKAEMERCPLYTFRHPTDNQLNAALMIKINLAC